MHSHYRSFQAAKEAAAEVRLSLEVAWRDAATHKRRCIAFEEETAALRLQLVPLYSPRVFVNW